ncbi:MAG: DUF4783 domain-containing protein [Flavobacteriales bacterium]
MKPVLTILLALFSFGAFAQTDITPKVSQAIQKGDAASVAAFFMSQVEIEIDGNESMMSSAQAQATLTQFFAAHPAKSFSIKHQGTSKLDDQYRIGDLTTANGNFRVTFFMKKNGDSMQIKQLKIEKT